MQCKMPPQDIFDVRGHGHAPSAQIVHDLRNAALGLGADIQTRPVVNVDGSQEYLFEVSGFG